MEQTTSLMLALFRLIEVLHACFKINRKDSQNSAQLTLHMVKIVTYS